MGIELGTKNDGLTVISAEKYFCFKDKTELGWPEFATHRFLRWDNADHLLPEDRLNIMCSMTYRGTEVNRSGNFRPTSTFSMEMGQKKQQEEEVSMTMLRDLLKTGYQADLEVKCGQRTFSCHKNILGSRSSVFMATLEHDMLERASGVITIDSLDPVTVSDMLTHIYGGKIEGLEEKADKLLTVSDLYDLKL